MNKKADIVFDMVPNGEKETIRVEWYDLVGCEIPDLKWKQVHIIANNDGKIVLPYFDNIKLHNLPGGHIEIGEDVEATIRREFAEETGGTIIEWEPIGYQVRIDAEGKATYQLRVYAKVSGVKDAVVDYDGLHIPVNQYDIIEMIAILGWDNPVGKHIYELVEKKFR